MTNLPDLFKHYRLLSDPVSFSTDERTFLEQFLAHEYALKEQKKREYLLRMSGLRKVRLLTEFDWTKIPRKVMEFMHTDRLTKPSNLLLIGPSGVGKTHIASALCYDAVLKGKQTIFTSLFDLTAKLEKARSVYSLIDYYAKIPVLCLDEMGYVLPPANMPTLSSRSSPNAQRPGPPS
jgi:DNA replication protein DnaC